MPEKASVRMLVDWLTWLDRVGPPQYSRFSVVDVSQLSPPTVEIQHYLRQELLRARFNMGFLQDALSRLSWEHTRERIRTGLGTRASAQRGLFGEILSAMMLAEFHGYSIPVGKLRLLITGDQTQPGTDIIAFQVDASRRILEVCFVESKLRTGAAAHVAVEGYQQLLRDYSSLAPDMLWFVAERLHELQEDPASIYEPFMAYFRNRADNRDIDAFRLILVWEDTVWTETTLQNLQEEEEPALQRLVVHVARLPQLQELTTRLLTEIGVHDIIED